MPTSSFFCLPSWGSSKSIYKAIETGILLLIVEIKKTVFWNKVPDQIGATIVSHQAHSNLKKGLVNCIGKMRKLAGLFVLISRQISKGSQDFFFHFDILISIYISDVKPLSSSQSIFLLISFGLGGVIPNLPKLIHKRHSQYWFFSLSKDQLLEIRLKF